VISVVDKAKTTNKIKQHESLISQKFRVNNFKSTNMSKIQNMTIVTSVVIVVVVV